MARLTREDEYAESSYQLIHFFPHWLSGNNASGTEINPRQSIPSSTDIPRVSPRLRSCFTFSKSATTTTSEDNEDLQLSENNSSGQQTTSSAPKPQRCPFCGYDHGQRNNCNSGSKDPNNQDGSGDSGSKKEPEPKEDFGGCGGGKPPPKDGGKGDGRGDGKGDGRGDKGDSSGYDSGNGRMNGDDRRVCPDEVTDILCLCLGVMVVVCLLASFLCAGKSSFSACVVGRGSSCKMNDKMAGFFNKSGESCQRRDLAVAKTSGSSDAAARDAYKSFKKALQNSECYKTYGGGIGKCTGLVDYAASLAGGKIISTGKTREIESQLNCRCNDKDKNGQVCDPRKRDCDNCGCERITVHTIIKEEERLTPGKCWAFAGQGEVRIGLFFPIVVFGVSIHHPLKEQLPTGFITSAPKDFEVWGMNELNDTNPHHFGKFQYKLEDERLTQIFEVQKHTSKTFSQLKFHFISNHGNPNYTSLYKVGIHGFLSHFVNKTG